MQYFLTEMKEHRKAKTSYVQTIYDLFLQIPSLLEHCLWPLYQMDMQFFFFPWICETFELVCTGVHHTLIIILELYATS